MTQFTTHTLDSAPESAKPLLMAVNNKFGFIPNMLGVLAESPSALKGYLDIAGNVAQSSLSLVERDVVFITASRYNGCEYCVAAHTFISHMQHTPEAIVNSLRSGDPLPNTKLELLRTFTIKLLEHKGFIDSKDIIELLESGYTKAQLLEVILVITQKILSNYANHLAQTRIDDQFEPHAINLK